MRLPYTICFIQHSAHLLLIERRFPPLQGLLNGVGGKLEPGETPRQCILREVAEETGLHLTAPRFSGLVTWRSHTSGTAGMYAYVDTLPDGIDPAAVAGDTPEGRLLWVPLADVLEHRANVVSNLPVFLPPMLAGDPPAEHVLTYAGDELTGHTARPLSPSITY